MIPAHKQTDPAKAPGVIKNDIVLQPCRSPYCECSVGKCTHPGYYDARGTAKPAVEKTLSDYIKRLQHPVEHGNPTALYDRGWNAALEMVGKYVNTIYPHIVLEESDRMWCAALDNVTQVLDKEKK